MAARDKRGRFVRGGARKRKAPARRRAPARSRTYRSNPPRRRAPSRGIDLFQRAQQGLVDGLQVVVGTAGARMLPTLFRLDTQGPLGLGIQLASAVAIGAVAENFVSRDAARMMVAGGVAAPLQSLAVSLNIPVLSGALLAGYPQGGRLIGYPRPGVPRLEGYPQGAARLPAPFVVGGAGSAPAGSF